MAKAKKQITEEQLKTVKDQQGKLNGLLRSLGVLDLQKENISVFCISEDNMILLIKKKNIEEYKTFFNMIAICVNGITEAT